MQVCRLAFSPFPFVTVGSHTHGCTVCARGSPFFQFSVFVLTVWFALLRFHCGWLRFHFHPHTTLRYTGYVLVLRCHVVAFARSRGCTLPCTVLYCVCVWFGCYGLRARLPHRLVAARTWLVCTYAFRTPHTHTAYWLGSYLLILFLQLRLHWFYVPVLHLPTYTRTTLQFTLRLPVTFTRGSPHYRFTDYTPRLLYTTRFPRLRLVTHVHTRTFFLRGYGYHTVYTQFWFTPPPRSTLRITVGLFIYAVCTFWFTFIPHHTCVRLPRAFLRISGFRAVRLRCLFGWFYLDPLHVCLILTPRSCGLPPTLPLPVLTFARCSF